MVFDVDIGLERLELIFYVVPWSVFAPVEKLSYLQKYLKENHLLFSLMSSTRHWWNLFFNLLLCSHLKHETFYLWWQREFLMVFCSAILFTDHCQLYNIWLCYFYYCLFLWIEALPFLLSQKNIDLLRPSLSQQQICDSKQTSRCLFYKAVYSWKGHIFKLFNLQYCYTLQLLGFCVSGTIKLTRFNGIKQFDQQEMPMPYCGTDKSCLWWDNKSFFLVSPFFTWEQLTKNYA